MRHRRTTVAAAFAATWISVSIGVAGVPAGAFAASPEPGANGSGTPSWTWRQVADGGAFGQGSPRVVATTPSGLIVALGRWDDPDDPRPSSPSLRAWFSADGTDWFPARTPGGLDGAPSSIAVGPDASVATVPGIGSPGSVLRSDTGVAWQTVSDDGLKGARPQAVIAVPDGFLLAGAHGAEDRLRPAIWTSPDGLAWTRVATQDVAGSFDGVTRLPDGTLVATVREASSQGPGGWSAWTSPDGVTWSLSDDAFGAADIDWLVGPVAGSGAAHVVALAPSSDAGTLWSTVDGKAWTPADGVSILDGVVGSTGSGLLIADATGFQASADGIAWTAQPEAAFAGHVPTAIVALPDGDVLVLGRTQTPSRDAEQGAAWLGDAAGTAGAEVLDLTTAATRYETIASAWNEARMPIVADPPKTPADFRRTGAALAALTEGVIADLAVVGWPDEVKAPVRALIVALLDMNAAERTMAKARSAGAVRKANATLTRTGGTVGDAADAVRVALGLPDRP